MLRTARSLWQRLDGDPRPWLLGILCVGAGFRVLAALIAGVSGEEPRTLLVARSVAAGQGFRLCDLYFPGCGPGHDLTAQVGPVPSVLFAGMLRLAGERMAVPLLVALQMGLGLLTVYGIFVLTRILFGRTRPALLAALLCATYPHLISYELFPREEPLFTAVLVGALVALMLALREARPSRAVVAGIGFGVASLCRFALVYAAPLLTLVLPGLARGPAARRVALAGAFGVAFALVMLPWVWRNERAFGAFVPGGTLAGYNLYRHNFILAEDRPLHYVEGAEADSAIHALLRRHVELTGREDEVQLDRLYGAEAKKIIRAHPWRYLELSGRRVVALFTEYGVESGGLPLSWWVVNVEHLLFAGLALVTLVRRRFIDPPGLLAIAVLLGYYVAGHALANARLRYIVPVMPVFMVLAAESLDQAGSALLGGREPAGRRRRG